MTFGIACASRGAEIFIFDDNVSVIHELRKGNFDLIDSGLDGFLSLISRTRNMHFVEENDFGDSFDLVVIAIGTGLEDKVQGNDFFKRFEKTLLKIRNKDFHLMLRSTVAIGTTSTIFSYIRTKYPQVTISFCPERSVEGNAINDCLELPQIVSGVNDNSLAFALKFFESISINTIVCTNPSEAELCKLICNVWRDTTFAIANEFSQIASHHDIDIFNAIEVSNRDYNRSSIPIPGPVAGPCLTKDSSILTRGLFDTSEQTEKLLVNVARNINSSLSKKIIKFIRNNFDSVNCHILILGSAFKGHPPTKDTRNSFGVELYDNFKRDFEVSIIDPEIDGLTCEVDDSKIINLINDSDVIILTTNHNYFNDEDFFDMLDKIENKGKYLIDLWPKSRKWDANQLQIDCIRFSDWHTINDE